MPTLPPRRPRRGPVRESLSPDKLKELTGVGPATPDYDPISGGTRTYLGPVDSNPVGTVPFKIPGETIELDQMPKPPGVKPYR